MTEPETHLPPESITAWHPMLVAPLEIYLPSGWQLIPELLLSRLPQRVDIVILELVGTAPGVARKLLSIFEFLRPQTLIEQKGPTDDLAAEDALVLLAYGAQYMRLKKLKDPAYRGQLLDSLARAIARYKASVEGTPAPETAPPAAAPSAPAVPAPSPAPATAKPPARPGKPA